MLSARLRLGFARFGTRAQVRARRWIFGVGVGLEFRVRVSGLGVRVTVKGSAQVAGRRVPVWELLSLCSRSIGDCSSKDVVQAQLAEPSNHYSIDMLPWP